MSYKYTIAVAFFGTFIIVGIGIASNIAGTLIATGLIGLICTLATAMETKTKP